MERTPCEIYSRVCGYYRPVKDWNDAKVCEFTDRKVFKINESEKNESNENPAN